MPPKRRRPSFSSLNQFSNCQLKYFLDASTPRRPDTEPQARGKQVHNLLEFAAKRVLEAGDTWTEGLRQGLDAKLPGPLSRKALEQATCTELAAYLEDWWPLKAEEWIEWDFEGRTIVGKLDLQAERVQLRRVPTIIDYKFVGHAGRILSPADARRGLQLRLYCLFKDLQEAGFIYILPTGRIVPCMVSFSDKELEQTRAWLSLALEAMETCWKTGVWAPASPDYQWCSENWCPHWRICLGKGKE